MNTNSSNPTYFTTTLNKVDQAVMQLDRLAEFARTRALPLTFSDDFEEARQESKELASYIDESVTKAFLTEDAGSFEFYPDLTNTDGCSWNFYLDYQENVIIQHVAPQMRTHTTVDDNGFLRDERVPSLITRDQAEQYGYPASRIGKPWLTWTYVGVIRKSAFAESSPQGFLDSIRRASATIYYSTKNVEEEKSTADPEVTRQNFAAMYNELTTSGPRVRSKASAIARRNARLAK